MTVGQSSRSQEVTLAENIALLHLLDKYPGDITDHSLHVTSDANGEGRTLSFHREHHLASSLAFLAEVSDDPNHVVAVAVEERPEHQDLLVLVAINREHAASAESTLGRIRNGLQSIFDILARLELGICTRLQYDVLSSIVRFCGTMILKRISSKRARAHTPSRARAYFGGVVTQVLDSLREWSTNCRIASQDRSLIEAFVEITGSVTVALDRLESCPEPDLNRRLEEVLLVSSQLNKSRILLDLLRRVPIRHLGASLRDGFLVRIGELARYYEISRHLYQSAKNIRLVRRTEIKAVQLDWSLYERPACPSNFILRGCMARCGHGRADLRNICRIIDISLSSAANRFSTRSEESLTKSKVHAEVQILAHYELAASNLPPRIICSSKDACYLCNEFIRIHGKFKIPKSHGRLYPGWRLPSLSHFDGDLARLNMALQERIHESCRDILTSNRRPPAHTRSERAVVHYSSSMSTIRTLSPRPPSVMSTSSRSSGHRRTATPKVRQSLTSIAERPARLPTPDESSDSDTPTLRVAASIVTVNAAEYDGTTKPTSANAGLADGGPSRTAPVEQLAEGASPGRSPIEEPAESPRPETTTFEEDATRHGNETIEELQEDVVNHPTSRHLVTETLILLSKGGVAVCQLGDEQAAPRYLAGNTTIIPEFVGKGRADGGQHTYELHVEWLTDMEADSVRRSQQRVTDILSMEEDLDVDSGSKECVILEHGSTVVRIMVVRS